MGFFLRLFRRVRRPTGYDPVSGQDDDDRPAPGPIEEAGEEETEDDGHDQAPLLPSGDRESFADQFARAVGASHRSVTETARRLQPRQLENASRYLPVDSRENIERGRERSPSELREEDLATGRRVIESLRASLRDQGTGLFRTALDAITPLVDPSESLNIAHTASQAGDLALLEDGVRVSATAAGFYHIELDHLDQPVTVAELTRTIEALVLKIAARSSEQVSDAVVGNGAKAASESAVTLLMGVTGFALAGPPGGLAAIAAAKAVSTGGKLGAMGAKKGAKWLIKRSADTVIRAPTRSMATVLAACAIRELEWAASPDRPTDVPPPDYALQALSILNLRRTVEGQVRGRSDPWDAFFDLRDRVIEPALKALM